MPKKLPIGESDFRSIIEGGYYFVDKSLFIKAFIESDAKVLLITRPRRWGKSLNFSMLRYFFAKKVLERETAGLFDELMIANAVLEGERKGQASKSYIEAYQGQSPVIFLSFANVSKGRDFDQIAASIALVIARCCDQLQEDTPVRDYLAQHENDGLVNRFRLLEAGEAQETILVNALEILSSLLYKVYGKKSYIFLDEYDHPLNHAYAEDYLSELSIFMKNFLSAGFKTNEYLEKGLLTGVLRVAKASILSGLNNLAVYTVLDNEFTQYFGFTESEVNTLLEYYGLESKRTQIKHWYNGYQIGETLIYNPWSILNTIHERGILKPYWVNTGGTELLSKTILEADHDVQAQLEGLLLRTQDNRFSKVEVDVNIYVSFNDLKQGQTSAFWGLLLSSGYITAVNVQTDRLKYRCLVRIPNEEIYVLFQDIFSSWLQGMQGQSSYRALIHSLVRGQIDEFTQRLEVYLQESASCHDFTHESNYHTFVLGIMTGLMDTHYVQSNKEMGDGRPDIFLIPKDTSNNLGLVLEFKYETERQGQTQNTVSLKERLEKAADQALAQIDSRHYTSAFTSYPYVKTLLKVGIVFYKKQVFAKFIQSSSLNHQGPLA